MKNTCFISSAIDYPSAPPHAGHMYEKICCDVLARWNRLKGKDVHFSTGLDCHGSKISRYAREAGKNPQEFVEYMEQFFLKLCKEYNISYDDFIVRVPANDIAGISAHIRSWDSAHSTASFLERELRAREVYEKYLRIDRYFEIVFDREQSPYKSILYGD